MPSAPKKANVGDPVEALPIVLDVHHLGKYFGGLKAVSEFDVAIHEKELVGLIGPNGAGKTTVFNMITGIYAPIFRLDSIP